MLEMKSMIKSPRPTREEPTHVANAMLGGTNCVVRVGRLHIFWLSIGAKFTGDISGCARVEVEWFEARHCLIHPC